MSSGLFLNWFLGILGSCYYFVKSAGFGIKPIIKLKKKLHAVLMYEGYMPF